MAPMCQARTSVFYSAKLFTQPASSSRGYSLKSPKTRHLLSSPPKRISKNEWPQQIFEIAAADGQIPIRPVSIKGEVFTYPEFLDSLVDILHSRESKEQLGEYLDYFRMLPRTLTLLAIHLKRADAYRDGRRYRDIVRSMMLAASSRGDSLATYYLAGSAIRSGTFNNSETQPVWNQINHLVEQNDRTALLLLASKEQVASNLDRALEMAKMSRRLGNAGHYSESNLPEVFVPEPWHIISSIMRRRQDFEAVRKAVEDGILLDGDPQAYFDFAVEHLTTNDRRRIKYLTKAAASGVYGAALQVGRWYLTKARDTLAFPARNNPVESLDVKNCLIAEQWFRAALTHPETLSQNGKDLEDAVYCIIACGILKGDIRGSSKQLRKDLREHNYVGELDSRIKIVQDKANDIALCRKILDQATAG